MFLPASATALLLSLTSFITMTAALPQGFIPTEKPVITAANHADNPAMFLKVFDSHSPSTHPCTNQTSTLYPSWGDVTGLNSSCVNADTINRTEAVTCVSRFGDKDDNSRVDLSVTTCNMFAYSVDACVGPSVEITWTKASNAWIVPVDGEIDAVKSFRFACESNAPS